MASIGGILLILGAYYTYKGKIFNAIGTYAIADFIWLFLAFTRQDYMGAFFIAVGTALGLAAFYKMNKGLFHKNITKG